ncbi:MAG: four helix bundle protein [Candidatus Syntrophosphaera sp.]|nr:four helix bundle protein [Candidatus Syntrophosphaera sp.]
MYSYTDFDLYKLSIKLVLEVYKATEDFPRQEQFGLSSQMRRSAVSIPSNIAEGSGRHTTKEFIQYLYMSNGSLSELETHVEISRQLGFIRDTANLVDHIKRIRPMILQLIKTLSNKLDKVDHKWVKTTN